MKQCPNCLTNYADDSLQFCLEDGTPLVGIFSPNVSGNYDAEPETIVAPKKVEPIRFEPSSSYQSNQAIREPFQPVFNETEPKKPKTAAIVLISVAGTILLLGLGGLGAWLYFKNNKSVAVNVNAASPNRPVNSNVVPNQNANFASPSATPTPRPTLNSQQTKIVTEDVKDVINEWKDATENHDINGHIGQYADTVDYYKAGKVSVSRVRSDRARAFAAYDSMNINIDNVKVMPEPEGDRVTVVFDKEWNFEGEQKFSSGKVQQQLTLNKINGRWLITGEKDLRVYYTEK